MLRHDVRIENYFVFSVNSVHFVCCFIADSMAAKGGGDALRAFMDEQGTDKFILLENGKVKCVLTNHELPARVDALKVSRSHCCPLVVSFVLTFVVGSHGWSSVQAHVQTDRASF
jgi:hypothetical protein